MVLVVVVVSVCKLRLSYVLQLQLHAYGLLRKAALHVMGARQPT